MNEIKLKLQYCIVIAIFTSINTVLFFHTKEFLLTFSKVPYADWKEPVGGLAIFALITLAASIANIYALKECGRENIRNFLRLSAFDTVILLITIVAQIIRNNINLPAIAAPLEPDLVLLLIFYSIKSIVIGFVWYKKPGDKAKVTG